MNFRLLLLLSFIFTAGIYNHILAENSTFYSSQNCEIGQINFEPDCDGDISFGFINFDYANTSDSFNLTINNEAYTFAYADLPVNISPLPDNGSNYMLVTVVDQQNGFCINEVDHPGIDCSTNNDCHISNLVVEALDCTPNGVFFAHLDLDYANTSDSFDVLTDGTYFGTFAYSDLFINIGPFEGNGDALVFSVFDSENENCSDIFTILAPDCSNGNCEVWDLTVNDVSCNNDNTLDFIIDFNYANPGNDLFNVFDGSGNIIATYLLSQLPVLHQGYVPTNSPVDFLSVCINDNPNCCTITEFLVPECTNDCEIGSINFEPDCDGDISFGFINFDYANTSDSFDLTINNEAYTFAYADLPVNISPLPDNGSNYMLVTVIDQQNEFCINEVDHPGIDCSTNNDCHISNLVVEPLDCTPNGVFFVHLDLDYTNTSDSFDVLTDGTYFGTFAYSDLFINIGPFEGNGDALVFSVFDSENENCSDIFTILAPDCTNDCEIGQINFEPDCDGDISFGFINFDYANTSDSFDLTINNEAYTFAYADLPVNISPLPDNGSNYMLVTVIDQQNDFCGNEVDHPGIDCSTNNDCHISNLVVEPLDCTPNGVFFVHLDLDYTNTSDSFDVLTDGTYFGTFAYSDLFINIGPFEGNGDALVFSVFDSENENCSDIFTILAPDCTNDCEIYDIVAEPHDCDGNTFLVDFDFNYNNTSDSFTVQDANNFFGTFAYADLPITLGPFEGNGQSFGFLFIDQQDDNCLNDVGFEAPDCNNNNCEIGSINFEPDCDGDISFGFINFDYANTSDSFDLTINNEAYTFAYVDLPVNISPLPDNGSNYMLVTVIDQQNDFCGNEVDHPGIDCSPNNDCHISNLVVEPLDCTPNGVFFVHLDLDYTNTSDSFDVLADGTYFGTFAYSDLFINIGPFEGNGDALVFSVFDSENENCSDIFTILAPDCNNGNCEVWDLTVNDVSCNNDNTLDFIIDFNYANPGNDFFDVFDGSGNIIATYMLSQLPVLHQGYVPTNSPVDVLSVCINDNPNCCTITEFLVPECPNDCEIYDIVAETYDCDGNTFLVDFDFNYNNTSDSFTVQDANNFFGTFAYADLPITLGPFEGNGQNFGFLFIDQQDDNCLNDVGFEAPDCNNNNCEIGSINFEPDCDGDISYGFINFDYANTSDSFDLTINNEAYTFAYTDLPVNISPLPDNGSNYMLVTVIDQQNDFCGNEVDHPGIDCSPNNDCHISNLVVEALDCTPNGVFFVHLDLDYANTSDSFDVLTDGTYFGTFAYSDLFIDIGPFEGNGDALVFSVFDSENENCSDIFTILAPDCNNGNCEVGDLTVNDVSCNNDNTLDFIIDFNYANPGNDFFDVFDGSGNIIATYMLSQLPVLHQGYVPTGAPVDVLAVCINDNPNCCTDTEFLVPDCTNDCEIYDIIAEPHDCDGNTFLVDFDFDYNNTSDSFTVQDANNFFGTFAYADLPITLGPFEGNGQNFGFLFIDQENENCLNDVGFEAPDCEPAASTCIQFEGLTNGINYGGSNSEPGDLLMIENNVLVTLEGLIDPLGNLNYNYMFATDQDICSPFDAASDNRLFMFNGLRFDFSQLSQNPTQVTFPFHNCGIPFALSANDQVPLTYIFPLNDTTFALTPTVNASIQLDSGDPEEGILTLSGIIENFYIGGVELQIDNVCFNVENLIPDVWPGDANFDNIANNFDLLHVGIAFGTQGTARAMSNIDWDAMPVEDWDDFFADEETNYKHADCDGDGIVDEVDRVAILENYNLDHGPIPIFVQIEGTPNDPPFFVDLPEAGDIQVGQPFSAPIILGTEAIPIEEIYGLAFTISFDTEIMDESQVSIELGDSWMGQDGTNLIHLDREFASEGRIEVAITRTDQNNVEGFGTIGNFIGIIDDILGHSEVEVEVHRIKAIRYDETVVPLYTPVETLDLITPLRPEPLAEAIGIFPNPTSDLIYIDNQTGEHIKSIEIYNTLGQSMLVIDRVIEGESISTSEWPAGVYIVQIELETQKLIKRVEKINL